MLTAKRTLNDIANMKTVKEGFINLISVTAIGAVIGGLIAMAFV